MAREKEEVIPVSTIVERLSIPKAFLRRILQRLHKEGILKASKGFGGGFSLAVSADKIYLTKLIKIFQGPLSLKECFFKKGVCPERNSCVLKREIKSLEKYVFSRLKSLTIATLIRGRLYGKKKNYKDR